MAEFLKTNLQYALLLVGAIVGAMFMKQNILGINAKLTPLLPGSAANANTLAQILGAVLLGFVGYKVGLQLQAPGRQGFFHADTYESFDKLLPDDYYGMGGRMATPIDFSNAPPPAM